LIEILITPEHIQTQDWGGIIKTTMQGGTGENKHTHHCWYS